MNQESKKSLSKIEELVSSDKHDPKQKYVRVKEAIRLYPMSRTKLMEEAILDSFGSGKEKSFGTPDGKDFPDYKVKVTPLANSSNTVGIAKIYFGDDFVVSKGGRMEEEVISASDWREDYERTGNRPAAVNPQEVMTYVRTRIINLQSELQSLECDSDNPKTEDDMRRILKAVSSTQDLVDAYVAAYYKYKFYEDLEYDQEEGTDEYEAACALTDTWSDLMGDLEAKVVKAASEEGLLSQLWQIKGC
ncbi:MAG: hypothetical protein K6G24_14475 [Lachnospiraceae bacterium]|nr:hypothetical protein [Lachnospiraceae bacterium]